MALHPTSNKKAMEMKRLFRNLFNARRWHAFLFSPLWLGLPVAAAVAFGVVWGMFSLSSDPEIASRCLRSAMISGGCTAFAWILGMFAASGPDSEEGDVPDDCLADAGNAASCSEPWRERLKLAGWCLLFLLLISVPDIRRVICDSRPVLAGVAGVVTKLFAIVAVAVPVYISMRRR